MGNEEGDEGKGGAGDMMRERRRDGEREREKYAGVR